MPVIISLTSGYSLTHPSGGPASGVHRPIEETNQFVWLLSYDGLSSWTTLDKAFHQSDERRMMKPDPARNIARTEHYFIDAVE